jgi:hypothetical protein
MAKKLNVTCDNVVPTYIAREQKLGNLDYTTNACSGVAAKLQEDWMTQSVNIAGAMINVFPLLGLNNQGSTIDLLQNGSPITSGSANRIFCHGSIQ